MLLEKSDLSWGMRMAITYRSERMKILKSQLLIVNMCQYVVMYAVSAVKDGLFRELILR